MSNQEIAKSIIGFIGKEVEYDKWGGTYIWGKDQKNNLQMVATVPTPENGEPLVVVRGWGAIQNLKNLPCSPEDFQDHLGRFIAEAINEKIQREKETNP